MSDRHDEDGFAATRSSRRPLDRCSFRVCSWNVLCGPETSNVIDGPHLDRRHSKIAYMSRPIGLRVGGRWLIDLF